jgi:GDP-L-fucose synthase
VRVIVTGGSGFLGKYVIEELVSHGHLAFPVSRSTGFNLLTREGRLSALDIYRPDALVHAAASVGGIGANVTEPGRFFYENAVMGMELMELCRLSGVAKFVVCGTSCEYPAMAPQPLSEEYLWEGYPAEATAAYGLAKRALLEMGQAYRSQYGFNVIHLLPSNLYGPRDHFNLATGHVIPALIRRLAEAAPGSAVTLWGSGKPTRDFVYVADAAVGVRLALEKYDEPEPLNLGTGVEYSIASVAEMIAGILSFDGEIKWDRSMPEGVQRRAVSPHKAQAAIGFKTSVGLPQGLRRTIDWYLRDLAVRS